MKNTRNNWLQATLAACFLVLCVVTVPQEYTISLQDVELADFIEEVATITGRSFVVDPRLRGTVTVISERKLDAVGVYTLLESVLRVQGYAIIDDGEVASITQLPNAKSWSYPEDDTFDTRDKFISRVIGLNHISSGDASRVLRQLVSQYGHLAPLERPNVLVISDHASNVETLVRLLRDMDRVDSVQSLVVPMKHAWVRDVANMLEEIHPEMMQSETQNVGLIAFANENNNTLFLRGNSAELAVAMDSIAQLDQPYAITQNTRIYDLQHADAEQVATVLTGLLGIEDAQPGAQSTTAGSELSVQADISNNSILARGNPSVLSDIAGILAKMDQPKLQVLIEAAIVEITVSKNAAWGSEMGRTDARGNRTPVITTSINGILSGLLDSLIAARDVDDGVGIGPTALSELASPTLAVAKLDPTGISFGAIINALTTDNKADLLSTPHVIALDNEESTIFVGQQVPFRSGTFGIQQQQGQTPLSTINRDDVGITLTVTPKIRDDLSVKMTVENIVGAVIAPSLGIGEGGFSDIVTSERRVNTTVVANNRQTIVLGGLIKDDVTKTLRRVPVFGSIPLFGRLFRSENTIETQSHLLVFLRPTVITSEGDLAQIVDRQVNGIWQLQIKTGGARATDPQPEADTVFENGF